jgi:PqqD family protein of HPr-rel-A system
MDWASAPRWRLLTASSLKFHAWPGEEFVLVFHSASGDTHLVDALSAEVLRRLQDGPLTEETLWRRLLEQTGFSVEEFPLDRLQPILTQLEQLSLVERATA